MSLYITQEPSKVVQQDIPENSKWSCIWHPLVWNFLRKDCLVSAIVYGATGSPAGIDITVTGDFTGECTAGDTVFVNASDGSIYGTYTVEDVTLSGGNTIITIDAADLGSYAANGYINLVSKRTYYMVEVAIYEYKTNGSPHLLTSEYGQFRPNTDGTIKADIQEWMKSVLSLPLSFDYASRTKEARHLGSRYDIKVREYWKESGYGAWKESTDLSGGDLSAHYIINAVRNVTDYYGQNMAEYVMWPTNATYEHKRGKFMTMFAKPKYFVGYPYSLGFIYDEDIKDAGQRLQVIEVQQNVNGGTITTTTDLIDENEGCVNHLVLKPAISSAYAANVAKVKTYLKAATVAGGSDATASWNVSVTGSSRIEVIDVTNNATIGNAQWDTDLATTLANLVTSINTNTQDGSTINGVPFGNTEGYTAGVSPGGGGSYDLTITAPANSGAGYNGITMWFAVESGTWTIVPFVAPGYDTMSGGVDGGAVDEPGVTTAIVSEELIIEVDQMCYDNPVYLRWANPAGYYDYWLFSRSQQYSDTTSGEQTFEPYIEDLQAATGRKVVIDKDVQEEIVVSAELLTKDQKEGLKYLFRSVQVDMLINADRNIWKTVRIKTGSIDTDKTDETMEAITLTIVPPQEYNQQQ